jgi:hypothetical protein
MKRDQGNNGSVFKVKEYDLKLRIVTKKFKEVKHEEIPDINKPDIMNAMLPGAKEV